MKLKQLVENEVPKLTDPWDAYKYAKQQKKRIPELEPIIMTDPVSACYYAYYVIKNMWPQAESVIMQDPVYMNFYLQNFPKARKPSKDVPLVLGNYAIMDVPNTITDKQVEQLIKIIEPSLKNTDLGLTYEYRLFYEPTIKQNLADGDLIQVTTKQLINDTQLKHKFLDVIECYNDNDFE